MQGEWTEPEVVVSLTDIIDFNIKVQDRIIEVNFANGKSGKVGKSEFLDFWNNTMTASQRVVVGGFIESLAAMIDLPGISISGEFGS